MTPKQKRLKYYNRHKKIVKTRRFVIGALVIITFIKLIQFGLEKLQ